MAIGYLRKCDKCGLKVNTTGPQECCIFHNGDEKVIKQLPHPGTDLAGGLFVWGFCPSCLKEVRIIVVEYIEQDRPFYVEKSNIKKQYLKNYSEYIKKHPKEQMIQTECFTKVIHAFDNVKTCPKCKEGSLVEVYRIIS